MHIVNMSGNYCFAESEPSYPLMTDRNECFPRCAAVEYQEFRKEGIFTVATIFFDSFRLDFMADRVKKFALLVIEQLMLRLKYKHENSSHKVFLHQS